MRGKVEGLNANQAEAKFVFYQNYQKFVLLSNQWPAQKTSHFSIGIVTLPNQDVDPTNDCFFLPPLIY